MPKYVERYSLIVKKGNDSYYIPLKTPKGEIKEKVCIEQIDYVTSGYKNLEDFLLALKRQNVLTMIPDKVFIQYKDSGEIKTTDLIFDNNLIRSCSIDNLNQKIKGINGKDRVLTRTSELNEYIQIIKSYMVGQTSYKSIMRSKIFPYHIKNYIKQYIELDKKITFTHTEQEEKKEIMKSIEYNLLKYEYLRKVIIWEKKYLNDLEKVKQKNPSLAFQMKLADYLENNNVEDEKWHDEYNKDIKEAQAYLEGLSHSSKEKFDSIHNGIYLEDEMLKEIILENFTVEQINKDPNITDKIIGLLGIDKVKSLSDEELYSLGFDVASFRNDYPDDEYANSSIRR